MDGAGAIQPGDVMTAGSNGCTLNFVYDGIGARAGRVYLGTAAHCVTGVGQRVSTRSVGDFGTVEFRGNPDADGRDYAFIRVDADKAGLVHAEVRGHPGMPTGMSTSSTTGMGDLMLFSGYGLGYSLTSVTREERVGVLTNDDGREYRGEGPIIFGDSGGPVLHESGRALGIVSAMSIGCCFPGGYGTFIEGPTVQGILNDAAAHGFTARLRTV